MARIRKLGFFGGIFTPKALMKTIVGSIEELPPPSKVLLPLLQHSGAPANLLVKRGDRVFLGQMIAEPNGMSSAAIHSPLSGSVLSIGLIPHPTGKSALGVEIESDGQDEPIDMVKMDKTWKDVAPQEIVQKILSCGIVGLGGKGVPTHLKLSPPADKPVDIFCINATSSEPMVQCDEQLILEKTDEILTGALIIKKILGAQKAIIAISDGNNALFTQLSTAITDQRFKELSVIVTKNKYPQGAEKILSTTLTKREIPIGKSAIDIGCVVLNAATVYAIWNAVCQGVPLYQRAITVAGPCIENPKNVMVRFGTPLQQVLDYCKFDVKNTKKIMIGGSMLGLAQSNLDVPIIKTSTAVFATNSLFEGVKRYNCINCGKCISVCPMKLAPCYLMKFVNTEAYADAKEWGINSCIECGSCSYVCPSKINLVHFLMLGKYKYPEIKPSEASL